MGYNQGIDSLEFMMSDMYNQRQPENISPDVFRVDCGSRRVIDLIADTWSILLLYALQAQPLRYSELERKIEGISQKMLTQTLRQLEHNGLVIRTMQDNDSSRTHYALSEIGQTLLIPLAGLCEWAQDYMADVTNARERDA